MKAPTWGLSFNGQNKNSKGCKLVKRIATGLLVMAALGMATGCSRNEDKASEQVAPAKLQTIAFEGLHVPGNPDIAKQDGFTDCSNEYSYFKCSHPAKLALLGVEAKEAFVQLNRADAFKPGYYMSSNEDASKVSPAQLSYRSVSVIFDRTVYDSACVEKHKKPDSWVEPEECIIPGGIDSFKVALKKAGWAEKNEIKFSSFYKQGVPLHIHIRNTEVTLQPLTAKEADEAWQEVSAKQAAEAQSAQGSQAFIDSMKAEKK